MSPTILRRWQPIAECMRHCASVRERLAWGGDVEDGE